MRLIKLLKFSFVGKKGGGGGRADFFEKSGHVVFGRSLRVPAIFWYNSEHHVTRRNDLEIAESFLVDFEKMVDPYSQIFYLSFLKISMLFIAKMS